MERKWRRPVFFSRGPATVAHVQLYRRTDSGCGAVSEEGFPEGTACQHVRDAISAGRVTEKPFSLFRKKAVEGLNAEMDLSKIQRRFRKYGLYGCAGRQTLNLIAARAAFYVLKRSSKNLNREGYSEYEACESNYITLTAYCSSFFFEKHYVKSYAKVLEEGNMEDLNKKSLPEKYSDNSLIRALVQMIPSVGPIIDALLAYPGTKIRERRIYEFLRILHTGLRSLESRIVDLEFLNTEEFYDLFISTLESSVQSRSKEKLVINVMILTKHLTLHNKSDFKAEEYIRAIADLTPLETKILGIFYDSYINDSSEPEEQDNELIVARRINAQGRVMEELGFKTEEELFFMLQRLERTGLIKEIAAVYWDYSGGIYTVTQALFQLMEQLSDHPFSKMNLEEIFNG